MISRAFSKTTVPGLVMSSPATFNASSANHCMVNHGAPTPPRSSTGHLAIRGKPLGGWALGKIIGITSKQLINRQAFQCHATGGIVVLNVATPTPGGSVPPRSQPTHPGL